MPCALMAAGRQHRTRLARHAPCCQCEDGQAEQHRGLRLAHHCMWHNAGDTQPGGGGLAAVKVLVAGSGTSWSPEPS